MPVLKHAGRWWIGVGRLDVEVRPAAKGYVRCDPVGTEDHTKTPMRRGGTVDLRPSGRLPGISVTWMSERAYRWAMAANAWYWRREDAKGAITGHMEPEEKP